MDQSMIPKEFYYSFIKKKKMRKKKFYYSYGFLYIIEFILAISNEINYNS